MRLSRPRVAGAGAALLLTLGPALGYVSHRLASERETERALTQFEMDLVQRVLLLDYEVSTSVEILHALASLYAGRAALTQKEFATFAGEAVFRRPAIVALEWVARVSASERGAHERGARDSGAAGYEIAERGPDGERTPAAPRDDYYPVRFVEPLSLNPGVLGFDLGSETARRAALMRATESGEASLSATVTLLEGRGGARGFLAVVPLYGGPEGSVGSRRENLRGFVVGAFSIDRLIRRWKVHLERQRPLPMEFALVEDRPLAQPVVMHASSGGAGLLEDDRAQEVSLALGGQQWRVRARPQPAYLAERRTGQPVAMGIGVFLVWELMVGLLLALWDWTQSLEERKQSASLRSVLRSVSDGVLVSDTSGRFLFANQAARRIVGSSSESPPVAEWSRTYGLYLPDQVTPYPPDDLPLARAVKGEEVSEAEVFVRNGNVPSGVWLSVNGSPLVDESGQIRGGVVAFRDVTARRRSEEAVRRLSSAVEQTDDAVLITDLNGRIEYVNPAFEKTTGYTRDEVLGRTPAMLKSGEHEADFYGDFWAKILSGEVFRGTIINKKKSGELYYAEQTVTPVRSDSGEITHFVSVAKDMTDRRKAQEQETELRLASAVHRRLFPQVWPRFQGLDIAGVALPAATVCGDYLDYLEMSGGCLGIVIGDASGHGMGPALVMAQMRAYLRSLVGTGQRPGEILEWLNRTLVADLEDHHYATLFLATLEPADHCLSYASAGHTPGFLLDAHGEVKAVLESTGVPLGMFPDREYATRRELCLDPGDLLVLTTDGVTEASRGDGSQFGREALVEAARKHRHASSAQEIVQGLREQVRQFVNGGPQLDDMTILVARRDRRA